MHPRLELKFRITLLCLTFIRCPTLYSPGIKHIDEHQNSFLHTENGGGEIPPARRAHPTTSYDAGDNFQGRREPWLPHVAHETGTIPWQEGENMADHEVMRSHHSDPISGDYEHGQRHKNECGRERESGLGSEKAMISLADKLTITRDDEGAEHTDEVRPRAHAQSPTTTSRGQQAGMRYNGPECPSDDSQDREQGEKVRVYPRAEDDVREEAELMSQENEIDELGEAVRVEFQVEAGNEDQIDMQNNEGLTENELLDKLLNTSEQASDAYEDHHHNLVHKLLKSREREQVRYYGAHEE